MAQLLAYEDRKKSPRPSYFTHDLADDFPDKEAAPPNRVMHDMMVKDLDDFLEVVKQSPKKLTGIVAKHRGEEDDSAHSAKPSGSVVAEVLRSSRNLISICNRSGRTERTTV